MTNRKIIIGLSASLLTIIAFGLVIGFVIVPSLTNKEKSTTASSAASSSTSLSSSLSASTTISSTTSSTASVLNYENSNQMVIKLILNSDNKWTQSGLPFEIRDLENNIITPEQYTSKLALQRRIKINGLTYDITELTDSEMTIKRTQLTVN
jgi:hypothetical protein